MTDTERVFERLVGDLDYPMFIVTTAADRERAGCLIGFATQASIDPPRLLVLLSKANETFRVASAADLLAVHFLGTDNKDLAALFGEESGDWTDKFARCDWREAPGGVPVLAGVKGWILGRILERMDTGDHVGHLIEPFEAEVGEGSGRLMFQQVTDMDPGHPA